MQSNLDIANSIIGGRSNKNYEDRELLYSIISDIDLADIEPIENTNNNDDNNSPFVETKKGSKESKDKEKKTKKKKKSPFIDQDDEPKVAISDRLEDRVSDKGPYVDQDNEINQDEINQDEINQDEETPYVEKEKKQDFSDSGFMISNSTKDFITNMVGGGECKSEANNLQNYLKSLCEKIKL